MLTDEEKREIEAERGHYADVRALLPHALHVVQEQRGWVSDDAVADVAAFLALTAEEVDTVATFYNLVFRRPVGRHVILVCDSIACWIMGSDSIVDHLRGRLGIALGETTPDGRFTLLPVACLGACDKAPAMMVDKDFHGSLTPERTDTILERYA